jgi:hypothetical protein
LSNCPEKADNHLVMIAPNALVIIKAAAFSQLLLEHADSLLAVVNDDLLGPVHPSGTADQDEGRGFMVQSSRQRTMANRHCVAERPLALGRKDQNPKSLGLVRVFEQYGGIFRRPYCVLSPSACATTVSTMGLPLTI